MNLGVHPDSNRFTPAHIDSENFAYNPPYAYTGTVQGKMQVICSQVDTGFRLV